MCVLETDSRERMNSQGCKCGAMSEEVVSGTKNFTSWKTAVDAELNSIRSEGISQGVPTEAEQRILQNLTSDLQVISDCITRKTACIAKLGTTNAGTQDTILKLKEQIASEKQGMGIAQQRLSYVRAPGQTTSFYQSWFPLDRPLKRISVPILSGFLFFFLLLSLGTLLMVFGINLAVYRPGLEVEKKNTTTSTTWSPWSTGQNSSIQNRYRQIQQETRKKELSDQKALARQ